MALPLVYVAGKITRAPLFKEFRSRWKDHIIVNSRWLNMTHIEGADYEHTKTLDPALFSWCWTIDIRDVKACNALIAYAEVDDVLRGAIAEVGAALAHDKPVFLVGHDNPCFGSWQYHPLITRVRYCGEPGLDLAARIVSEWHGEGPLTQPGGIS